MSRSEPLIEPSQIPDISFTDHQEATGHSLKKAVKAE